jgi:O-antigen ligase
MLYILSFGAFLWVANQIRSQSWLEILTWVFIVLGSVYILGRISGLPVDNYYQNGLVAGSMFWTWLIALMFGQALLNDRLHPMVRAFLFLVVAIGLYELYFQLYDWKSGWLPSLISIAAILVLRYPRAAKIIAPLIMVPALYYLATRAISSDAYSWGTRIDIWLIVIDVAKISPIFGLGFSNYHFYVILVPIRGYYLYFNSHSQYVDLFAQVGLLGLICYLWFFGEAARLGLWLRKRAAAGFSQAYVYGVLGGIAGTLVAGILVDWTLPFAYNIGMAGFRASVIAWVFLGGLAALEQITLNRGKAQGIL